MTAPGHKMWCQCDVCMGSQTTKVIEPDPKLFSPDEQQSLRNYRLAILQGLYSDWPGEIDQLVRDVNRIVV